MKIGMFKSFLFSLGVAVISSTALTSPAFAQSEGICCGKVGAGTTTISDGSGSGGQELFLDVAGAAGATHYCDEDGLNCSTAADLAGSTAWTVSGSNIYYNTGNVSIGITGSYAPLAVARSGTTSSSVIRIHNEGTKTDGQEDTLAFYNYAVSPDFMGAVGMGFDGGTADANKQMTFYVANVSTPKMVIENSGYIGIGDDSQRLCWS